MKQIGLLFLFFFLNAGLFSQVPGEPDSIPIIEISGPRFLKADPDADSTAQLLVVRNEAQFEAVKASAYPGNEFPVINFEESDLVCISFCHGCRGWTHVEPFLQLSGDGRYWQVITHSSGCFTHRCISTGIRWLLIPKKRTQLPIQLNEVHDDM